MIVAEITQKGAKLNGVEAAITKALKKQYKDVNVRVYRKDSPESRADRFSDAQSLLSEAKSGAEELRDELQEWLDDLPENLQGGDKASQLEEAISNLEEFISGCENAESVEVDFPGMF